MYAAETPLLESYKSKLKKEHSLKILLVSYKLRKNYIQINKKFMRHLFFVHSFVCVVEAI